MPLMLAEQDRDAYRRTVAAVAREKEIMKDVPGWEVSFYSSCDFVNGGRKDTEVRDNIRLADRQGATEGAGDFRSRRTITAKDNPDNPTITYRKLRPGPLRQSAGQSAV